MRRRHRVVGQLRLHALAVLFVLVALSATLALQAVASRAFYILFVPAVMFAAWIGGLGAGLTASAATVVLAVSFLLPSEPPVDQLAWVIVAGIVTVATSTLVARRRLAEQQLTALLAEEQARRGEAESDSRQKSELLAQVAHELRQPLGAMMTAARLLATSDVASSVKERATSVIARQTLHLLRLVEDLLDLSRMTHGELQLRKANLDLCEVAAECAQSIEPDALARQTCITVSVPDAPVLVHADGTRIRQIMLNLLTNAVKFTEPGGSIHLVVEQGGSEVVIRVRDNGRGIPADRLSIIFELFHTGGGEGSGLGVGLALVKGLTESHGGTVRASSQGVGHGSEFVVTLPTSVRPAA